MRRFGNRLGVLLVVLAVVLTWCVPVAAGGAEAGPERLYTVVFTGPELPADAAEVIAAAGGEVVLAVPEVGMVQAKAPGGFVGRVLASPGVLTAGPSVALSLDLPAVEVAETEGIVGPADLYNRYQWDIKRVTRNGASFGLGTGSHDVVVGVLDTGCYPHPDLARNLLGGRNLIPALGFGNDPTETGDPSDYLDRHGHGTHCAGTIAANGRCLGVGPDLGVRAYRVLTREGSGYTAWIVAGMVAAVDDGCRVLSMSLGGYCVRGQVWWTDPETGVTHKLGNDIPDLWAYRRAVEYAVRHGALVVAAAGNDAWNCTRQHEVTERLNEEYGPLGYTIVGASLEVPGGVAGVVTVSATGPDDLLSSYSNYGPSFIDLAAPGGDFKLYPQPGWWYDMCLNCYARVNPDGSAFVGWAWMAGTSMATPKVAGVAALVAAAHPDYDPARVRRVLFTTAEDIGKKGADWFYGYGLVDAYAALGGR